MSGEFAALLDEAPTPEAAPQAAGGDFAQLAMEDEADRTLLQESILTEPETTTADVPFKTLVRLGLVDDPQTRERILAEADLDREPPTRTLGGFVRGLAAEAIANAPAEILGAAGAVAGFTRGGPAGAAGGAALGSAAGEGYRKALAAALEDEPQTSRGNLLAMNRVGALGAAGEGVGGLLAKWLGRRKVKDIGRLDEAQTSRLTEKAKEQGIDLTPAELTNLRSLINRQAILRDMPDSADLIEDFLEGKRTPQIEEAVQKFFGRLSSEDAPMMGFLRGQRAAQGTMDTARQAQRDAAGEFYRQARASADAVDVNPVVSSVQAKLRNAAGPARENLTWLLGELRKRDDSGRILTEGGIKYKDDIDSLHQVKEAIDDRIETASDANQRGQRSISRRVENMLVDIKGELVDQIEKAGEGGRLYSRGRQEFIRTQEPITAINESMVKGILRADENNIAAISTSLFGKNSSPLQVAKARRIVEQTDPEGWGSIVRGHLQTVFDDISDSASAGAANVGGQFRKKVFGSKRKRAMMKNAMTPTQFGALSDMMDVLNATGRAFRGNSTTMQRLAEREAMQREAAGVGTTVARNVADIPGIPRRLGNWIMEMREGAYVEDMARMITAGTDDSLRLLKNNAKILRQASPREEKFLRALGTVGGLMTGQSVDTMMPPPRRPIGISEK